MKIIDLLDSGIEVIIFRLRPNVMDLCIMT